MKLGLESYGNATGDDFHIDTSQDGAVKLTFPNGHWVVIEIAFEFEEEK